jgi:hypothetical protein
VSIGIDDDCLPDGHHFTLLGFTPCDRLSGMYSIHRSARGDTRPLAKFPRLSLQQHLRSKTKKEKPFDLVPSWRLVPPGGLRFFQLRRPISPKASTYKERRLNPLENMSGVQAQPTAAHSAAVSGIFAITAEDSSSYETLEVKWLEKQQVG